MKTALCLMWLLIGSGSLALAGDPDFSGHWALLHENGIAFGVAHREEAPKTDSEIAITRSGNKLVVESQCGECGHLTRALQEAGK